MPPPSPSIITSFRGPYAFLSNFYPAPVVWGKPYSSYHYPTVEHAYQAAKTDNPLQQNNILHAPTPGAAKRLGHTVDLRPDWDYIKLSVMHELLRTKFQDPDLARLLLATGEAWLVEGNDWGDAFWGVSRGAGENWLGRLLVLVRSELWRTP